MILETTEIRWFWIPVNLPSLTSWFSREPAAFRKAAEARTDEYLLLPNCRTTGIKLRDGYLEVKALVADAGRLVIQSGLTGQVQRWAKWTTKNHDGRADLGKSTSDWQKVTKVRLLRQFAWNGEVVELTNGPTGLNPNCHIELTMVSLVRSPKAWVTLGIETFGEDIDQLKVLREMAQHLFRHPQQTPNELLHADSLSYPGWLTSLE